MNNLKYYTEKTFEDIKHIDSEKNEYWEARELQIALGYKEWRYFQAVIEKAQIACVQSNNIINDHFGVYTKMVEIGSSTERSVIDYKLSRYACYLIVQNANPKYETVALGQTYFAIQTRKYWNWLKNKVKREENFELSSITRQLKLKSSIIIKIIGSDSNGMDRRTTTSN